MTKALFAEFGDAATFSSAVEQVRGQEVEILDAFTPFPIEGLDDALGGGHDGARVRWCMLLGGLAAAALAYGLETYSAVWGYPFDVGGRPHNSWPTFMLFPFEFGILSAGICGLLGLFWVTGLPRLLHAVFDIEGFGRASNDRFILALEPPQARSRRTQLEKALSALGALSVREVVL